MMTTRLPQEIAELPRAAAQYEQGVESPELAEQVEIEHASLDAWMAFKTTPYLVERIYNGDSLTVNLAEVRDEVVIPEFEHQQEVYVQESTDILASQIPNLKGRLGRSRQEVAQADTDLAVATAEKEKEHPSPRIVMQIPEAKKRLARHRKDVTDLTGSIHNRQLKVQTNVAVNAAISELLEDPASEEMFTRVDHITYEAKKAALRQVIEVFTLREGAIATKKEKTSTDLVLQEEYLEKIRVLRNELVAMETIGDEIDIADAPAALYETTDTVEIEVIPTPALDALQSEWKHPVKATRTRVLGGLGTAWAWAAGAAWNQK